VKVPEQSAGELATQPDWFLITNGSMRDWGPPYTETPDLTAPNAPLIAEPWNAVTASFFIFIAIAWLWRLRGRYHDYPFVTCCMPILLAGGIGGTLYHATRLSPVFFLLDVLPISLLGLLGATFMALRFWGRPWGWLIVAAVSIFYIALNRLFFAFVPLSVQWSVNISYAGLAVVIAAPMSLVLWRTRFRHVGWVVAGVVSFAIAWTCRLVDHEIGSTLPMGSHWLWHTFGAITTALIIQFFYLVEGDQSEPQAEIAEGTVKKAEA
jgi:hypothetical protein